MPDTRLIESAFPLKQVSRASVHEKSVRHGRLSTLHVRPARRPLAVSRAAVLAALLRAPDGDDERRRLLGRMAAVLSWGEKDPAEIERFRAELRGAGRRTRAERDRRPREVGTQPLPSKRPRAGAATGRGADRDADLLRFRSAMSTAAILAGGRALRFGGRPKPLLPLGGRRIVDRLLAALRAVADQVFIVADDCKPYAGLGVPVHPDVLAAAGPLGGVHAALSASRSARTLVVAGDMPFPNPPLLARLLRRADSAVDVAVPRTRDGWQPLCACYRAPCLPVIERRIAAGTLKAGDALRELRRHELGAGELAPLDPHGTLFFNVNTPADYARALALAAYHDGDARPRPVRARARLPVLHQAGRRDTKGEDE